MLQLVGSTDRRLWQSGTIGFELMDANGETYEGTAPLEGAFNYSEKRLFETIFARAKEERQIEAVCGTIISVDGNPVRRRWIK